MRLFIICIIAIVLVFIIPEIADIATGIMNKQIEKQDLQIEIMQKQQQTLDSILVYQKAIYNDVRGAE